MTTKFVDYPAVELMDPKLLKIILLHNMKTRRQMMNLTLWIRTSQTVLGGLNLMGVKS